MPHHAYIGFGSVHGKRIHVTVAFVFWAFWQWTEGAIVQPVRNVARLPDTKLSMDFYSNVLSGACGRDSIRIHSLFLFCPFVATYAALRSEVVSTKTSERTLA